MVNDIRSVRRQRARQLEKESGKASDYSLTDARMILRQLLADIKDGSTSLSKKATEDYLKHCLAKLGGKIVITPADKKMAEQKRLLVEEVGKNISITLTTNKRKA